MSHTPGPWFVDRDSGNIMFERSGLRRPLVLVITRFEESATHDADKKLIAAAPELLAALRAVTKTDGPSIAEFASAMELLKKLEGV